MNSKRHVVCLVINGLNIGFLGAYGNSWIQTPGFDSLAIQSTLFDQYYIHSPHLEAFYESIFRGTHPAMRNLNEESFYSSQISLPQRFNLAGYRTVLITDDYEVAFHSASTEFSERKIIDVPDRSTPAEIIEETHFYSFFAQIMDQIIEIQAENKNDPLFIWGHFSGWGKYWDFPLENRSDFADEGDPIPYSDVIVPTCMINILNNKQSEIKSVQNSSPSSDSSDNILNELDKKQSIQEAYCGGISVFDKALDEFFQVFQCNAFWNDSLFLLTSNRGFPLGEHRQIGNDFLNLYSEELHLPLMIHFPEQENNGCRISSLVDPCDIFVTLSSYALSNQTTTDVSEFSVDASSSRQWGKNLWDLVSDENATTHDYLLTVEKDALSDNRVVVTQEWFLRQTKKTESLDETQSRQPHYELFVLPDDRWNVNEVADRCEKELNNLIPFLTANLENKSEVDSDDIPTQ